jgi:hypothetical protein
MTHALTGGFRVTQVKLAVGALLPEPEAAAALESAQIVALAVLVREQLDPAHFAAIYRPFATIVPGPGYEPPLPIDRQIAVFTQKLPQLAGEDKAEVMAVAKVLGDTPKAAPPQATAAADLKVDLGAAALYAAAWKSAGEAARAASRTISLRAVQDLAEQAAPHDGSGVVGMAGVAACGIFMRDVLPIEQVLLLYEPFGAAIPYERLR